LTDLRAHYNTVVPYHLYFIVKRNYLTTKPNQNVTYNHKSHQNQSPATTANPLIQSLVTATTHFSAKILRLLQKRVARVAISPALTLVQENNTAPAIFKQRRTFLFTNTL